MGKLSDTIARKRRHVRIRKRIVGITVRPRLSVFRSLNHIYAQVIDDAEGSTIVSASTMEKEIKAQSKGKNKTSVASLIGSLIAKRAQEKGITEVIFDRGGYRYHGRVKALAEASRQTGLKF